MLQSTPLRVGSWPGRQFKDNAFIETFCQAIEQNGAEVVDVFAPSDVIGKVDVLQIHWPEQVYWGSPSQLSSDMKVLKVLYALFRLKKNGAKIVWMVHNLKPHDASVRATLVWKLYSSVLARLVNGYIALSPGTAPLIAEAFPFSRRARALAVRHPYYSVPIVTMTRETARRAWGVRASPLVLAFVGWLKPYKGAEALARAVRALPGECSAVIAGAVTSDRLKAALEELAQGAAIDLRAYRLSTAEFEGVVQACDYVVLPFQDSLHSGSVVHALSLGRPVLTRQTAFAMDLRQTIGPEWVQVFSGELTPQTLAALPPPPAGAPNLSSLAPEKLGADIMAFYRSLCDS